MKTISLELAKRLKDAGFEMESEYHWYIYHGATSGYMCIKRTYAEPSDSYIAPAYTFEEIWAMLPTPITIGEETYQLTALKVAIIGTTFLAYRSYVERSDVSGIAEHKSPAEAAGLLLEWAINEGHVK